MLETPEADPDLGRRARRRRRGRGGAVATFPSRRRPRRAGEERGCTVQAESTKPTQANPIGGQQEPDADHLPAAEAGGKLRHQRRDHDQADRRRQCRQPGLERAEVQRRGVLEVEAQQVHQRVDRAGADQDRHRGADQDAVAQQRRDRATVRRFGFSTATKANAQATTDPTKHRMRLQRAPAPVAALAQRQNQRHQGQRDQHRCRRSRSTESGRVTRLADRPRGEEDAADGDDGVDPEQPLPTRDVDQDAAEQRPGRCADRRGRTPERDGAQLRLAGVAPPSAGSAHTPGSWPRPRPG